jgi:hypothetical protein
MILKAVQCPEIFLHSLFVYLVCGALIPYEANLEKGKMTASNIFELLGYRSTRSCLPRSRKNDIGGLSGLFPHAADHAYYESYYCEGRNRDAGDGV